MEKSRCKTCNSSSVIRDDVSDILVCSNCGTVIELYTFDAQIFTSSGPTGTFIRVGTSGVGSSLNYRDKKVFDANNLIEDVTSRLGLSSTSSERVKEMIHDITEGEFGSGDWFQVLIAACSYVFSRRENCPLPITEVASMMGQDQHELGRMVTRVVDFLELRGKLPIVDVVAMFERAIRRFSRFSNLGRDFVDRMRKQGVFLIQCATKCFLTTGRRPVPMIVAILVFLVELNGIEPVHIRDVAEEFHAVVSTCKLRHKELLDTIVEAARMLPWGKDVTAKNLMKSAPLVMQYMEMKSMVRMQKDSASREGGGLDLGDVMKECLRSNVYQLDDDCEDDDDDQKYYRTGSKGRGDMEVNISPECLYLAYSKFLEEGRSVSTKVNQKGKKRRAMVGFDLGACTEWWKGESPLSRKLMLKEMIETDVGLDALPPSYINGQLAKEKRRDRINNAKNRITRVMDPSLATSMEIQSQDSMHGGSPDTCGQASKKEKKRKLSCQGRDVIDWEDFIIEMLLLHQVNEEEIEKGHYSTLVDLYVFNSGLLKR
ncbi:hypothetical protein MLD38_004773 [Melastoma candidum]|uniref:Uncharacterized protein n=1 Tax=Melastoma candidum TaxID=119954 RepID=A0ACB9S6V3_9MYRT|nr:hypothetical protein MLD38_004773 [Melastoma candidum]